ncbi:hypothetical protein AAF712_000484 [Marasmius tenuissimus]|uniref:Uncharacterized protein n=1 Tax=Marasmius tenuissimus TaxID=585030 RepID=A0ABR3AH51_9AGAR|nr:hypothetical protein PM082_001314 [Marasmius tenuissimus]
MAPAIDHETGHTRAKERKRSDSQKELDTLLKSISFSQDSNAEELLQSSRKIYSHINAHFLSERKRKRKHTEAIPSPEILIFAVRDILFPAFLGPTRIVDILDLVTNIEHYRLAYIQKVDDATVFQDFYSMRHPEVTLLTKEELATLQKVISDSSSLRSQFLSLVLEYCQLDIHHLCTSPPLRTDAGDRIERYIQGEPPVPFSQALSTGEKEQLQKIIEGTLRGSMALVKAYNDKKSAGLGRETTQLFPCPVIIEQLVDATESYLQDIEAQIAALRAIFPS